MITILTVDDDPHIRELLRLYIQKEGFRSIEAVDGQHALDILAKERIHLAIVDIMMPNVDGYELCEQIRKTYDIPVMMLTAKRELVDKEKAYLAGTDDYVIKPLDRKSTRLNSSHVAISYAVFCLKKKKKKKK